MSYNAGVININYIISGNNINNIEVVKYLLSVGAPLPTYNLEKIKEIVQTCRKYRKELLPILDYKIGHVAYILLDYLEYGTFCIDDGIFKNCTDNKDGSVYIFAPDYNYNIFRILSGMVQYFMV